MSEYFKIGKVEYEGKKSKNPFSFRHYNPDEILNGKPMREHLKFALSYWHTLGGEGVDMFGSGTADKTFGGKTPMETARYKVDAAFELMNKLNIDYFCFHDKDIAPEGESLSEFRANLDEIVPLIKERIKHITKNFYGEQQICLTIKDMLTVQEQAAMPMCMRMLRHR